MANTNIDAGNDYSFWQGVWKTIKNALYFLTPAIIATATSHPEITWLGPVAYFVKNFMENKDN